MTGKILVLLLTGLLASQLSADESAKFGQPIHLTTGKWTNLNALLTEKPVYLKFWAS